jgi:hypothetical protein
MPVRSLLASTGTGNQTPYEFISQNSTVVAVVKAVTCFFRVSQV